MTGDCTVSCSLTTTDADGFINGGVILRRLLARREYSDSNGSVLTRQTLYSASFAPGASPTVTATVTEEDGTGAVQSIAKHHFPGDLVGEATNPNGNWRDGHETLTETFAPNGALLRQKQQTWGQRPCFSGENCWYLNPPNGGSPAHDPQVCQSNLILEDGTQAATLFLYDNNNMLTDRYEYDWNAGPAPATQCPSSVPGGWTRHTATGYRPDPAYGGVSVLPQETTVTRADGVKLSDNSYNYDEYSARPLVDAPGIAGHDAGYSTGYTGRGNLTTVTGWQNMTDSWMPNPSFTQVQYTYDIAGNRVAEINADNHLTQYGFAGSNQFAAPTSITRPTPAASGKPQQTTFSYDFYTGKPTSATDANGLTTQYAYNDPLDRLTQSKRAAGTSYESQTNVSYPSPTLVTQQQDQAQTGDSALQTQQVYDGFGRPVESRQWEDGSRYIAVDTAYDAFGRAYTVSNPTRVTNGTSDGLGYLTTYSYDALGRVTAVQTVDGAQTQTCYVRNRTTVTDPAGKVKQTTADALGRLTQVIEDPQTSDCPQTIPNHPGGLNYVTTYSYL